MKEYRLLDSFVEFSKLNDSRYPLNSDQSLRQNEREILTEILGYSVIDYWLQNNSTMDRLNIYLGASNLKNSIEERHESRHIDRFDPKFPLSFSVLDQFSFRIAQEVVDASKSNNLIQVQSFFQNVNLVILKEFTLNPCLQDELLVAETSKNQESTEVVLTKAGIIQCARALYSNYQRLEDGVLKIN